MEDEVKELEAASAGSTDATAYLTAEALEVTGRLSVDATDTLHMTDAVLVQRIATPAFMAEWMEEMAAALAAVENDIDELRKLAGRLGVRIEDLEEEVRSLRRLLDSYRRSRPSRSHLRKFAGVAFHVLNRVASVSTLHGYAATDPVPVVIAEFPTAEKALELCALIDDDSRLVDDPMAEAAGSAGDRVRR